MKLINKIALTLSVLAFCSCGNYLDIIPDDIATIDNAFSLRASAKKYLYTCYSYLPVFSTIGGNPAIAGADEITCETMYRSAGSVHSWYIARGFQLASNVRCDFWRGVNGGKDLYEGINMCNTFLEKAGNIPDITDEERNRWIDEVKFLKAYFHFYLTRMYGPVPIKDKNLDVGASPEEVKVYRNTLDECFDYVVALMDEVINDGWLPEVIDSQADELGRITLGIVLAAKAEVLMTAASPLFNGNSDYQGYTDNRGVEIFCPNKTDEQKLARWQEAAAACKDAIDFLESHGHGLYYFESNEYPISESTRYKMNVRGAMSEPWNIEKVWGYTGTRVGALQNQSIPRGLYSTDNTSAQGNMSVPLKFAAIFYTKNGLPIDEDITWDYENRFGLRTAGEEEKTLLKKGYTTANFNFDREYRYYADLAFDGGVWFGNGTYDEEAPKYVQSKVGQSCANFASTAWNITGIWPKKYVNWKTSVATTGTSVTQIQYVFPIISMSSLYLYYAEALNECGEDWSAVLPWIDAIRKRAGIPDVATSWTEFSRTPDKFKSKVGLRSIIHRERAIEMAFEGQRFWDLRRWKEAFSELNKPVTSWNLEGSTAEEYYQESLVFEQKFEVKDYFFPIANDEVYANNNTLQNFGW